MGIKIVKEKVRDYTFIEESLNLEKPAENKDSGKKDRIERDYKLKDDFKLDKLKHKSKVSGGHSKQGHSPVYE